MPPSDDPVWAQRLSSKDLQAIEKRALPEGLPYPTLISSLLHKHAAGRLKEIGDRDAAAANVSGYNRRGSKDGQLRATRRVRSYRPVRS